MGEAIVNMNITLACKLLQACNLSYRIDVESGTLGQGVATETLIAAIGLDPKSIQVSVHGANLIDACLFGKTTDGDGILAFRGTLPPDDATGGLNDLFAVARDWMQDAEAALVADPDFGGKVHFGFRHSLEGMWDDIKSFVRGWSGGNLYVTGHSKGGSLAHLAAYRLARTVAPVKEVYSFAAARAGDAAFVDAFNTAVPDCWRFEYQDDLVPHLPPASLGWLTHLNVFRAENAGPMFGDSEAGRWFEDLLTRLNAMKGYASAGTLEFIDWDTPLGIQGDSDWLDLKRQFSLAELLVKLKVGQVAGDHSSTGGYKTGVCGP